MFVYVYIYTKCERKIERDRQTNNGVFNSLILSPKASNSQGGPCPRQETKTPLRLSTWVAEPRYLSHHLCLMSALAGS